MRYNDVTDGTKVLDEVLPRYRAAWEKKQGIVGENGLFRRWWAVNQDKVFESDHISHTVW